MANNPNQNNLTITAAQTKAKKKMEKLIKNQKETLNDLQFQIEKNQYVITTELYPAFFKFIKSNIFRDIPFDANENKEFLDEEENINIGQNENMLGDANDLDALNQMFPEWPVVKIIYNIFLNFLNHPTLAVSKSGETAKQNLQKCSTYINGQFISRLMLQMNTKNFPERDIIKVIIHKLYDLFIALRQNIRANMSYTFHRCIYEKHKFYGIPELLEISAAIISGLSKPIKIEHREFLFRSLIPLHVPESYGTYNLTLSYCLVTFLSKEPNHINDIINSILKYWPKQVSLKETWFIDEIEYILEQEFSSENINKHTMTLILKRLLKSLNSHQFQVSSRAAAVFENSETLRNFIKDNANDIVPMVLDYILEAPHLSVYDYEQHSDENSEKPSDFFMEITTGKFISVHWNDQMKEGLMHVFDMIQDLFVDEDGSYVKTLINEAVQRQLKMNGITDDDKDLSHEKSNSLSRDSHKENKVNAGKDNSLKEKSVEKSKNNENSELIGINSFPTSKETKNELLKLRLRNPRNYYLN